MIVPIQPRHRGGRDTSAFPSRSRPEIDHPEALVVRDGGAGSSRPGGAPVIFDAKGVSQVIGDRSGQGVP